jgi:hypothetical protein
VAPIAMTGCRHGAGRCRLDPAVDDLDWLVEFRGQKADLDGLGTDL